MKTEWAAFIDKIRYMSFVDIYHDQEYFAGYELVPENIWEDRGPKIIELINPEAFLTLLEIRILADTPIRVNDWHWGGKFSYSGWRPPNYYKDTFSCSQHILFNAYDFNVKDVNPWNFRQDLIKWKKEGKLQYFTGLEEDVPWVHIDCRKSERLDDDGLFIFGKA